MCQRPKTHKADERDEYDSVRICSQAKFLWQKARKVINSYRKMPRQNLRCNPIRVQVSMEKVTRAKQKETNYLTPSRNSSGTGPWEQNN